jgi:hypothetical protein
MTDQRKLPTDQVAKVAKRIFLAAHDEDNEELNKACHKWLNMKGYRKAGSLITYTFSAKVQRHDIEVHVEGFAKHKKTEASCLRMSGWTKAVSEEQTDRAAGGLLIGIEAAINAVERIVLRELNYPEQVDVYRLYDAMRMVTALDD